MSHFAMVAILPPDTEKSIVEAVDERVLQYRELGAVGAEADPVPDEFKEWRVWDDEEEEIVTLDTEEEARAARKDLPGNESPYQVNTQSKWDWYSVGGRWSPYFRLKEDGEGRLGEPGIFGRDKEPDENDADVARKRDIDFEQMMDESESDAREFIDTIQDAVKGIKADTRSPMEFEELYDDRSEAYDMFWDQPKIQAAKNAIDRPLIEPEKIFLAVADPKGYIEMRRNQGIAPYGFVHADGEWEAKGRMGWWGMSDDDYEEGAWNGRAREIIENADDDAIFVALDFHV